LVTDGTNIDNIHLTVKQLAEAPLVEDDPSEQGPLLRRGPQGTGQLGPVSPVPISSDITAAALAPAVAPAPAPSSAQSSM